MKILRWGLMRRLRRGAEIMLNLTFRCTLSCDYCAEMFLSGKMPKSGEIELDDWKYIINNFPTRISTVRITGGEPTLVPYFVELINWLTNKGIYVMVFSNMSIYRDGIKPTRKLLIEATYHTQQNVERFLRNLKLYRKTIRVNVHQLDTETIKGIRVFPVRGVEYAYTCVGFIYNPEGKLYLSNIELLKDDLRRDKC